VKKMQLQHPGSWLVNRLTLPMLFLLAACTAGTPALDTDNQTAESSGIIVRARTDCTVAALDETIRLTLSVTAPPHVQLHLPEVGAMIAGLRIVDFGETGPTTIDNRIVVEKWFDLRADIRGAYIIPAMTVRALDRNESREITTPQIFIKVGVPSAWSDNATMQDIIDIKPLVVLPRDLRPFIIAAVSVLVLLVCGLALWFYIRKRRASSTAPPKAAHILAYEQLEQLERDGLLERGSVQEYYIRLSDIFRHYLQNRFVIPAVEQTTQELLRSIGLLPDMPNKIKSSTRDFLRYADLVKFAKYCPENDAGQRDLRQVRESIDQTRLDVREDGQVQTDSMRGGDRQ